MLRGVKSNVFVEASGEDFETEPGPVESAGYWSPYALDADLSALHWARTPRPAASYDAPFLYLAQYRHADALGASCPTTLPAAGNGRRDFVFSVGRCGSTVLTRIAMGAGLATLSEPDAIVALTVRRLGDRADDLYGRVLDATIRASGHDPAKRTLVKLRAQHSTSAHLQRVRNAVPGASFLFVFREPRAWARSMVGHFGLSVDRLVMLYSGAVEACAAVIAAGDEPNVLLYEDMVTDARSVASALDLDPKTVQLPERSSQSGTRLAGRPTLDEEGEAKVTAFLRHWPGIARDHAFLPYNVGE